MLVGISEHVYPMKTTISETITATASGKRMAEILRSCVHCGMCNATCPTYQLKGDELDGPRGRIYLIKSMLEGEEVSAKTQTHLDRCLTCRSCETTCPSGVQYGQLVELARPVVDEKIPRKIFDRLRRWLVKNIVPYPGRFHLAVLLGSIFKPFLPRRLAESVPTRSILNPIPNGSHARQMVMLEGCAQSVVAPSINQSVQRLFDHLGVSVVAADSAGCCGAVNYHLNDVPTARQQARINIDAWWSAIEAGAESILVASSGCAMMIKEYPALFADDPAYLPKAERVASLVADPAEKMSEAAATKFTTYSDAKRIAFQVPCTMQHGTHKEKHVKQCLEAAGFNLTNVVDAHLCCGSAGSYSLLQPALSEQLLDNKLSMLMAEKPEMIVTANIGCYMHLARRSPVPVKHWLEVLVPRKAQ